jgi:hypothetical protein
MSTNVNLPPDHPAVTNPGGLTNVPADLTPFVPSQPPSGQTNHAGTDAMGSMITKLKSKDYKTR